MLMLKLNNKKNIAILFSGGVESTLLYYLTLKQSSPETNIKLFIVDRYNNPIERAFFSVASPTQKHKRFFGISI